MTIQYRKNRKTENSISAFHRGSKIMKKIGKIIPDIVIRSYTNNYNIFQFNEADVLIKQGIIAVQKNNKKDSIFIISSFDGILSSVYSSAI